MVTSLHEKVLRVTVVRGIHRTIDGFPSQMAGDAGFDVFVMLPRSNGRVAGDLSRHDVSVVCPVSYVGIIYTSH